MTEFKFNKLTPLNDIDIDSSYIEAMKYALEDEDIKNIAISGNYGSGKSSFIETYKSINKDFKPLHISLAHFSSVNNIENGDNSQINLVKNNAENSNLRDQTKIIEGKIINQLLHQIDSKYIPMTIFKSKKNPRLSEIVFLSATLLLFVLPTLLLLNYSQLAILSRELLPTFPHIGNIIRILAYLILTGNLISTVYRLSKLQLNRRLIKILSFRGTNISGEIEVFQNEETSYFDKYLDDVLYLFDNCQSNIIIFEDIDRFQTNLIFEKLREINTLVNNKKKKEQKLLFIYLVKDDMFISQDRTKFFDFIIPIIPVVTSSNSGEKIGEILTNLGESNSVSKALLKQVAIYIDDMRLAYNICNEFVLYKNNLFSQEENDNNKLNLSVDKIFAIIVYKNIFPKDFSLLQKDLGFLHQLYIRVDDLKQDSLAKKSEEIKEIERLIISSEQEISKNKLELYSTFMKVPDGRVAIRVNGKLESEFPSRVDFIREILTEDAKITSIVTDYYYNREDSRNETIDSVIAMADTNFQERMNALENRSHLKELNFNLEKLREEYESIKSKKLSALINRNFFDAIMEEYTYLKKEKNSLIMYLLRNGYIDESYPDYITYFYPNSLKKQDKEFLNAVQGELELSWDYQLVEVAEVNDRLNDSDFTRIYVLNFDLFEYILHGTNEKRLGGYLSDVNVKFINKFLQQSTRHLAAKITVLEYLIERNQRTLKLLLTSDDILKKERVQNIILLLSFFDFSNISWQEELQETISYFVSSNWLAIKETSDNFIESLNNTRIQDNLKFMDVKIKDFSFEENKKIMSDFVYEHNLYEINTDNLSSLLSYLDNSLSVQMLKDKPFSILEQFDNLKQYIGKNRELYMSQILPLMNKCIHDDLQIVYDVVNDTKVAENYRVEYLKKTKNYFLEISNLSSMSILDAAIEFNKATYSTKNILNYFYNYDSWNERLIEFVNNGDCLDFLQSELREFSDKLQEEFLEETVKCNKLNNDIYKEILSKVELHCSEFEFENISDEKMSILIGTRCISAKFSINTLNFIRDNYQNHTIEYLKEYIEEYLLEDEDNDIYQETEMLNLLQASLSHEWKFKIVDKFPTNVSIVDKEYSTILVDYILQNKFDESDLEYILSNYDCLEVSTRKIVEQIFVDYLDEILEEGYSIKKELLQATINNSTITIDKRRLILANYIDVFADEEIMDLFRSVKMTEMILAVTDIKNPKVDFTDYNKLILEYLKGKRKIASYRKEGNGYRIYSKKIK